MPAQGHEQPLGVRAVGQSVEGEVGLARRKAHGSGIAFPSTGVPVVVIAETNDARSHITAS